MSHHATHRPRHPAPRAHELQEQAYRVFARWCSAHDPDGDMDILDAAAAYSIWAQHNSITPYLDEVKP